MAWTAYTALLPLTNLTKCDKNKDLLAELGLVSLLGVLKAAPTLNTPSLITNRTDRSLMPMSQCRLEQGRGITGDVLL